MDIYNFYTGKEFEAYEYLGAHTYWGGTTFRTFAPSAKHVAVIGDFSNWEEVPMHQVMDGNFWEVSIPGTMTGNLYKYKIYGRDGSFKEHADPFGFYAELRPATASIVFDIKTSYDFKDHRWMKKRHTLADGPMNIYELHFGSWRKPDDSNPDSWYNYSELGNILIPYLKENGFNFLEIMPLNEYPCDQSWGYQSTGFFAPTSRYGNPNELRQFIEQCHENDIAVILDFIPVHFAVNDYGLKDYDGGNSLFEYPNNFAKYNEWGSCNFMHSRGETCSFLQSAANFWLSLYHFDGLRMDAVGNLIYWMGDNNRGENKCAINFIKTMNQGLKERHGDILLFAEDSSSYQGVTKSVAQGGLGFDFKWDLGWMNDTLSYFQTQPDCRSEKYHKLTFSMMYYYNERFILPFSHDEVVHGKASIVNKMSDLYEGKFRQARALYMYMYAHPGKKLNFMGNEFGQLREWDEKRGQDFDLLKYPIHDDFNRFFKTLSHFYLNHPALSALDYSTEGFYWVDCNMPNENIYAFIRQCEGEKLLAVFNFSYRTQDYCPDLGYDCILTPLLNSNDEIFGGEIKADNTPIICNRWVKLTLPGYHACYYSVTVQ